MSSSSSSFLDTHRSRPMPTMPARLLSSLKRPFSKPKHESYPSAVCLPSHSLLLSHFLANSQMRGTVFSPTGPVNRALAQPHRATSRLPWASTSRARLTFPLTSRTSIPQPCSRDCSAACHHPPRPLRLNALTGYAPPRCICTPLNPSRDPNPTLPLPRDPLPARIHPFHLRRRAQR